MCTLEGTLPLFSPTDFREEAIVIGVVPDAARAGQLRKKFHDAGLYGSRISIHVGDPVTYPFPPFLANLTLSEDPDVLGDTSDRVFISRMFHHLRPYGGTLCLELDTEKRKAFIREVSASKLAGVSVQEKGDFELMSREGALPGADNWSHSGADAANTGTSQETFLKGDLGRLWYDSTYRWSRSAQSASVRIADGRMLIRTDKLQAMDVYTGRLLWEVDLSNYGSSGDEAVVGDLLYVTGYGKCIVLELATGKKKGDIALPIDIKGLWSHILVKDDHLFGAVGNMLLCVNRHDGNLIWLQQREREAGSLALGGGRVYCSDYYKRKPGMALSKGGITEAFDISTGKHLWKVDGASEVRYSEKHDLLVTANGVCNAGNGVMVWNGKHGYIGPIIGDNVLSGKNTQFTLRNLLTGEISGKELEWARRGCTPPRASPNFVTTRYLGNAAYIDIATRKITPLWNVRSSCGNNICPANGVLNVPNLSGGCSCNYIPISQALVPVALLQ